MGEGLYAGGKLRFWERDCPVLTAVLDLAAASHTVRHRWLKQ